MDSYERQKDLKGGTHTDKCTNMFSTSLWYLKITPTNLWFAFYHAQAAAKPIATPATVTSV